VSRRRGVIHALKEFEVRGFPEEQTYVCAAAGQKGGGVFNVERREDLPLK
jgi:hypothetical protein